MMSIELKNKWVGALRSGNYKQEKGALKTETGFCCLGVLLDLSDRGFWEKRQSAYTSTYVIGEEDRFELDSDLGCMVASFGLDGMIGHMSASMIGDGALVGSSCSIEETLIILNDDAKWDFSAIADWIEANVPVKKSVELAQ